MQTRNRFAWVLISNRARYIVGWCSNWWPKFSNKKCRLIPLMVDYRKIKKSNAIYDMARPQQQRTEIILNSLLMRSKSEFKCCPSHIYAHWQDASRNEIVLQFIANIRRFDVLNKMLIVFSFPFFSFLFLSVLFCSLVFPFSHSHNVAGTLDARSILCLPLSKFCAQIRNHSAINMPNNEKWKKNREMLWSI